MCLIVRRGDDLTTAMRDIPVYKIYIRRSNGVHVSPYMKRRAGYLNPGDVVSDEEHMLFRCCGEYGQDNIEDGVLHAFTSLNGRFFKAYADLAFNVKYMGKGKLKVYRMAVPRGAKCIWSHDGSEIGAKRLYVVGEVGWLPLCIARLRHALTGWMDNIDR